jgi:hypothetical protein
MSLLLLRLASSAATFEARMQALNEPSFQRWPPMFKLDRRVDIIAVTIAL